MAYSSRCFKYNKVAPSAGTEARQNVVRGGRDKEKLLKS